MTTVPSSEDDAQVITGPGLRCAARTGLRPAAWRRTGWLAAALVAGAHAVVAGAATVAEAGPDASGPGYEYYAIGATDAPTPGTVEPGLALLGGGDWPVQSMRWFAQRAGGGHVVVLRARGGRDLQDEIYRDVGGVVSVETLVIHDEEAAEDPRVLAVIGHADGIFIGGGDQSHYVRLWKNTSITRLLDAHVAAGRPIGGTSAGLAVLGAYVYGCLDSISLTSSDALANPTGPGVTVVRNFLHLPFLTHVITDSHFEIRDRLGRLITFVGRLVQEEDDPGISGLGIDEEAALVVDGNGIGTVYANGPGYAWLVRPLRKPKPIVAGQPLSYERFTVVGVGTRSRIDLNSFAVSDAAFRSSVEVRQGALLRHDH